MRSGDLRHLASGPATDYLSAVSDPTSSEPAASPEPAPSVRPKRRPRYSGRNPRRFEEKYKELDPAKYATDIAKVMASGKTPAGMHRPILVAEILEILAPQPGNRVVDCTLGYGGHAVELLQRIVPSGCLMGLDVDPIEMPKTIARLRALGFDEATFVPRPGNFAGLAAALVESGWGGADCVLADLGVSSMQIDNPDRGFTFKFEGPLDLRLNPQRGVSAADWLARVKVPKLAAALSGNSDEPHAELLAPALSSAAAAGRIRSTTQLAEAVRSLLAGTVPAPGREAIEDSVRRVFQAIRIEVNDEFSALDTWLRNLPQCLKPGGRVAVLTFHSGEDRRVKHAFREGERAGLYSAVAHEVTIASPEERRANPRSSSAKLRWAVRAEP